MRETNQQNEVAALWIRVLHPQSVKALREDIAALLVLCALFLEETPFLRLLDTDGSSFLKRRIAAEDDTSCGGKRGVDQRRRADDPTYSPAGRSEHLCVANRGEYVGHAGDRCVRRRETYCLLSRW